MNKPERIFFTGVPGSRWSGIAQQIEEIPWMNTSDRIPEREYTHGEYSGHKGAYFGKDMELHPILDAGYIDQAWGNLNGTRLVKSHDWAYKLDDVYKFAKQNKSWLMLVYRPDIPSFDWWKQAGGFNITYPSYSAYIDEENMFLEIQKQNRHILEFSFKYDVEWSHFNRRWIKENFEYNLDIESNPKWSDILVSILK